MNHFKKIKFGVGLGVHLAAVYKAAASFS